MLAPSLLQDSSGADAAHALARWINRHHRQQGDNRYSARRVAERASGCPALVVEMRRGGGLIGTYECGVAAVGRGPAAWLVLAPLVVIWNGPRPADSAAMGSAMIDHLVGAARAFRAGPAVSGGGILIASGNLTQAKGGKPFFERLGWEIVVPETRSPRGLYSRGQPMRAALAAVEERIDSAIAPLREAGKIEAEPISFALLVLR